MSFRASTHELALELSALAHHRSRRSCGAGWALPPVRDLKPPSECRAAAVDIWAHVFCCHLGGGISPQQRGRSDNLL